MAIQAEFGIAIPDDRTVGLLTLGDIRDLVSEILEGRSEFVDRGAVWERIRPIMRRNHDIAEEFLAPEAALADFGRY